MEVLLGRAGDLEALPGVGRAPVQQLGPGHVVLARHADLPVAVDHELGSPVLEGWRRREGKEVQRLVSLIEPTLSPASSRCSSIKLPWTLSLTGLIGQAAFDGRGVAIISPCKRASLR